MKSIYVGLLSIMLAGCVSKRAAMPEQTPQEQIEQAVEQARGVYVTGATLEHQTERAVAYAIKALQDKPGKTRYTYQDSVGAEKLTIEYWLRTAVGTHQLGCTRETTNKQIGYVDLNSVTEPGLDRIIQVLNPGEEEIVSVQTQENTPPEEWAHQKKEYFKCLLLRYKPEQERAQQHLQEITAKLQGH